MRFRGNAPAEQAFPRKRLRRAPVSRLAFRPRRVVLYEHVFD
jgi:hypothetical protein